MANNPTDVFSFNVSAPKTDGKIVCYSPTMITTNGIFQGEKPLEYALPLFMLQLGLIVITTRFFLLILKPFRQPRVIAEIIGGIVLGPSVLGNFKSYADNVFPLRSIIVLETMANVGLLYFVFLVGIEMDLNVIRYTGKKALIIALASMGLPFIIGASPAFLLDSPSKDVEKGTFFLYMGVALSITAYPVLVRILAELKLLNTELGRLALSSAIINDIGAWILFALAISLSENGTRTQGSFSLTSLWVLVSSIAFVVFCILVIRPAIKWVIQKTPEGENFNDFYICLILTGVMICGFITDSIGTHTIFGAFLFGLLIPNGPLATTLIEKLEDLVAGLLLPLFFALSGLRTNLLSLKDEKVHWAVLMLVVCLCSLAKIFGTFLAAMYYRMPFREGIALGLLMNTKGLVEIVVLNIGRDQKVFNDRSFAVMVIITVLTTSIVTPIVIAVYRPARSFGPYKRRTIQRSKPDSELRLLACIHTPRNVPTIINLLETSYPTKRSPIYVYALHLVELTGRASSMVIVHNSRTSNRPAANRTQAQSDHIVSALENYEQHAGHVSIQNVTAISPYSTMHEDICNLAEDKRVSIIIVPFHKQQTIDGGMEASHPAFRTVNQNVLANAPCSVGILVDRGLGASSRVASARATHHILVLFFGGPDDREALAYASRMSANPNVSLTVLRFFPGEEANSWSMHSDTDSKDSRSLKVGTDNDRERQLDDDIMSDFRMKTVNDEKVIYMEKVSNNGEETVAAIRSMDSIHDLYVVGRGQGMMSPLTAGLTDWSECPELGAVGDVLASSDFSVTVSVLVVQQYVGMGLQGDPVGTPDSPGALHPQNDNKFNNFNIQKEQNQPWKH